MIGSALFLLLQLAGPSKPVDVPLPAPSRQVELLERELASSDGDARAAIAWELSGAPEVSEETVALLKELRHDPNRNVRYGATWAFTHLTNESGEYHEGPRPLRTVRPKYPDFAKRAGIEGTVTLEVLIGEEGEIAHSRVLQSIPALDDAATSCVRQWRFKPATRFGKPASMVVTTPVTFNLH